MHPVNKIVSRYPLFLLTIPGSFLVHMANYYYKLLDWRLIIGEMVLYTLVPVVIYLLFFRNDRLRDRLGVLLLFLLVIFYFFHAWHEGLKKTPATNFLSSYSILLPALAIVAIILIIFLVKRKPPYSKIYYAGNILFLLLLAGGLIEQIYLRLFTDETQHDLADPHKKLSKAYTPCDTCAKPDIYFIILDGYTNSKTLATEFNYNNEWITQYLRNKNFYVPGNSNSNYYFTQVSIASTLNMNYLQRLDTEKLFQTKEFFQAHYTIHENEWCGILNKQGYEINNYSIFDIKGHPSRVSPFLQQLTWRSVPGQTFFNKVNRDIGWHLNEFLRNERLKMVIAEAGADIKRIQQTLDGVIKIAKTQKQAPQFTYAHFVLPHETFFFDSTGQKTDLAAVVRRGYKPQDYIQQVAYTNRFVIAPIVDSIFANAKRPFVIIFQGDHGYRSYPPEKLKLEFENFNAVYFPDNDYRSFAGSATSVNTFRIVTNHFFQKDLPLLNDSLIYLKKRVMFYR